MRRNRRREFIRALGAAGIAGLAGCPESSSSAEENAGRSTDGPAASSSATTTQTDRPTETESRTEAETERESETDAATEAVPEPDRDIGAVYLTFFQNRGDWDSCYAGGDPRAGEYVIGDEAVVERHLDLMARYGVSRCMVNFSVPSQAESFIEALDSVRDGRERVRSDALDDAPERVVPRVEVQPFYALVNALRFDEGGPVELLRDHATAIGETYLSRADVSTVDGRPVLGVWYAAHLASDPDLRSAVRDEWGGYDAFVDEWRDRMSVDGTDPYIVAGVADRFHRSGGGWPELRALAGACDGVTTWINPVPHGETTQWSDVVPYVEATFEATREFADAADVAFVPTVFPGFDDRFNECWGHDRNVPRDPGRLAELFGLADEYGTGERVTVASFNDWGEGHQVEPGTWSGTDYGTDYVEVVRDAALGN